MRPRICYAVTHGLTARLLLRGQLRFLRENGFAVTVIASPGPELDAVREAEGVDTIGVSMSRSVRLTEGPRALGEMVRALHRAKPDLLNASTPKAGLLGTLAGALVRTPARVYLVRGTLVETRRGAAKLALAAAERTATSAAHHVVFVSESLRAYYERGSLVRAGTTSVVPSNGVDVTRFRARDETRAAAAALRASLGIPADDTVVGFVGRLVTDKGVADMIAALEYLMSQSLQVTFLVVGGDLAGDHLPPDLERRLRAIPRAIFVGRVDDPAAHYAVMDVLLFPSHREGLPNVPLEAAASEVPTVGYRVTGVRDAVVDEVTGRLVPFGDAQGLGRAVGAYLRDDAVRSAHGRAARARVIACFEQRTTWTRWLGLYDRLLRERGVTAHASSARETTR